MTLFRKEQLQQHTLYCYKSSKITNRYTVANRLQVTNRLHFSPCSILLKLSQPTAGEEIDTVCTAD